MKLDVNQLRYLSKDEFRTLQAVEIGQKNHELVPVPLVDSIAGLRHGGTIRCLKALLRAKLVHHDNSKYDAYRLTNMGYDFLALNALVKRGAVAAVGRQIGVGKESDVFEVLSPEGERMALKLHRLGRTSFRAVQSKRDYLKGRTSFSWLYLSRLAALKEHAFMAALGEHDFPVPRAIAHNRHAVLMSLVDGVPLVQVKELGHIGAVFRQCVGLMGRLAALGLVHCDFNEFNLLVDEEEQITLIDFPQMISTSHANAEEWYDRDLACLDRFFTKKLGYIAELDPNHQELPSFEAVMAAAEGGLDVELAASGFKSKHQAALEQYSPARDGESGREDDAHVASSSQSGGDESAESAADSAEDDSADSDSAHNARHLARAELDSPTSLSDAEEHNRGLSPSLPTTKDEGGQPVPVAGNRAAPHSKAADLSSHRQSSDEGHSHSSFEHCAPPPQTGNITHQIASIGSGHNDDAGATDHDQDVFSVISHHHGQDRLSRVRAQLAAERKSEQKQHIHNRAAKGARQAAARAGRKAVAQNM